MVEFYKGKSRINGRGIFAGEQIKKGKIVFIMKGIEKRLVLKTKKSASSNPNMVGLSENLWMDPFYPIDFLNHSCDPNLGMKGRVLFVALKDIEKGEELCFDYSISEDSPWEMPCSCGSPKCRKIIKGIKFLPKETFVTYLPNIPRYFQKVYKKCKGL